MSTSEQVSIFTCSLCNYFSDRKYNYVRHIANKHNNNNENNIMLASSENVPPGGENVPSQLFCKKCNKKYNSRRYLTNHESKCKGVDILTCSRCMVSFTSRKHKSRHIKANNCKARSIICAREQNPQNVIIHNQTINNIQNNNNLIINNFGSERLDHISHDDIIKMLMAGNNTLPMYIQKKHFDKNFPENNNIVYTKENKCKVLENNCWKERDIRLLSSKLIKDNSQVLLLYCDNNEVKIEDDISDIELLERIKHKLVVIYNKSDNEKYNYIISAVKELFKNSND